MIKFIVSTTTEFTPKAEKMLQEELREYVWSKHQLQNLLVEIIHNDLEKTELLYIQSVLERHKKILIIDGFSGGIPFRLIQKIEKILNES